MRIINSIHNYPLKSFPGGDQFAVLIGRHEAHGESQHHTVALVKVPKGGQSDEHFHKEREESY